MQLHFVCSGNSYRSRLAEAYCRSIIKDKNITVSSSGIEATLHRLDNGPICWYAMRLMKRKALIPFMSWREQQTTKPQLQKVDYLVCMNQAIFDYCKEQLGYQGKPYEVWDIPDLNQMAGFIPSTTTGVQTDINHIQLTERTYDTITKKVDDLIARINLI